VEAPGAPTPEAASAVNSGAGLPAGNSTAVPPPPPQAFVFRDAAVSASTDKCVHFWGDLLSGAWLDVDSLDRDVCLVLHTVDEVVAHTALRHLRALPLSRHSVFVAMPFAMRKHPAFSPWLRDGVTISRNTPVVDQRSPYAADALSGARASSSCLMVFSTKYRNVHSASDAAHHTASFQVRVGGQSVRALFDTGASCCCIHKQLAMSLALPIKPCADSRLEGLGGQARVLGVTHAPIKIGKSSVSQAFLVLDAPIAGYDALIGQITCALSVVLFGSHRPLVLSRSDKILRIL
jgi:hypothetical protein